INYPHQIVIDGHASSDHRATPRYPDTLTLSIARAMAGADRLTGPGGIERTRLQVAGHGDERPLNTGNTVAGRAANRRIELRLLTLSRARAEDLERQIRERGFEVR
ncbi:MAG: OmpA family protein, partial [Planctomycetota bacterium]